MLVVNRRLSARQLMAVVRSQARLHDLSVIEFVGRGKGSHRVYLMLDIDGVERGRITVTDHPGDLSWSVLRDIEKKLTQVFVPRWTEKGR